MKNLFMFLALYIANFLFSQGGIWLPTQINVKEMKSMGMKLSKKELFNSHSSSLKDAIVHFNKGCTGQIISDRGLMLTNHHCAYGIIQSHSNLSNDLLTKGFWAKNSKEELPNKDLAISIILDIVDVTSGILNGVNEEMSEKERDKEIIVNTVYTIKELVKLYNNKNNANINPKDIEIKPFYKGNQYFAFIKQTFKDVRLVGAPPSSIGKFGDDKDNWIWPRHTGDFSLFRIYADKNNKPAEYSPDNIPYTPKKSLKISIKDLKEGDFTLVYGFPGHTDQYLPSCAIEEIVKIVNPIRISLRKETLKILDENMKKNPRIKLKYSPKYVSIANSWKKWIGESAGIKKYEVINKKKEFENKILSEIKKDSSKKEKYGNLLTQINSVYKENVPYVKAYSYYDEVFYRNSEAFKLAIIINHLIKYVDTPKYRKYKKNVESYITGFYENYNPAVDARVSAKLINMYVKGVDPQFLPTDYGRLKKLKTSQLEIKNIWQTSVIPYASKMNLVSILENIKELKKLKEDPLVKFVDQYYQLYNKKVLPKYKNNEKKINRLQRLYMKVQMDLFSEDKLYPDANSTLRVSYGKINGYQPKDGIFFQPFTYLEGIIEKYNSKDNKYEIPQKLIDIYTEKDFDQYGKKIGKEIKMPVNFIASNHTTGGNSGSPVLDAKGNLIGLNFDRVWEGTMSDLYYDPEICRNIMVDMRYILFIIDKYANASYLIEEMEIKK